MECVILVDNSNIFIEGQKASASKKGVAPNPDGRRLSDPSWRIDFARLLEQLANGRKIRSAILGQRFRSSNHIMRPCRACRSMCERPDRR